MKNVKLNIRLNISFSWIQCIHWKSVKIDIQCNEIVNRTKRKCAYRKYNRIKSDVKISNASTIFFLPQVVLQNSNFCCYTEIGWHYFYIFMFCVKMLECDWLVEFLCQTIHEQKMLCRWSILISTTLKSIYSFFFTYSVLRQTNRRAGLADLRHSVFLFGQPQTRDICKM